MMSKITIGYPIGVGIMALALACGSDGGQAGSASTATGVVDGSSGSGGSGSGGSMSAVGGAMSAAGGDGSGAASGVGGGAAGGGGGSQLRMQVLVSSRAVLEKDDKGQLTVDCVVLQDGFPYAGSVTSTVMVTPQQGVTQNGAVYEFDTHGIHGVSCEAEVDGNKLAATVDVAVLNEAIDPLAAKIGAGLAGVNKGLIAIMAANGQADQALVDAVAALDVVAGDLDAKHYSGLSDMLRDLPNGYPDAQKLAKLNIAPGSDDAALPLLLTVFESQLATIKGMFEGFDPKTITMADVTAVNSNMAALQKVVADIEALSPTAHSLLATRKQAAGLIKNSLSPTLQVIAGYTSAAVKNEAAKLFPQKVQADSEENKTPYFGLLNLSLGMFNSSNLHVQLVNKVYGKYIAELDKSINNLILLEAIDYVFPPNAMGPNIVFNVASASQSFAKVGYSWYIEGSGFNSDPAMNVIIVVGDGWQTVTDNILNACDIKSANTLPEAVSKMKSCVDDVKSAVDESVATPKTIGPGILGPPQHLDLGPFPAACSGNLPLAIGIIPINLAVGRGPAFKTNCIK